MHDFSYRISKYSDFFNPLLVREVRQNLRSNLFVITVSLASLFCILVMISGIQKSGTTDGIGSSLFMFLYLLCWGFGCLVIPVMATTRFRTERSEGEFDLFVITGIPAWKIVSGKLQSSLVQSFLLLSLASPFMMICYLLRGISVLDIFLMLSVLFILSLTFTQAGITLGALPVSKGFFFLLRGVFLFSLFYSFTIPLLFFANNRFLRYGLQNEFFLLIAIPVFYFLLMYLSALAILSLPGKNRLRPLKIFILGTAIILSVFLGVSGSSSFFHSGDMLNIVSGFFFAPFAGAAMLLSSGYESASAPVRIRRRKRNLLGRISSAPFYPGQGAMMIYCTLLALILYLLPFVAKAFPVSSNSNSEWLLFKLFSICAFWCFVLGRILRKFFQGVNSFLLSLVVLALPSLAALALAFNNSTEEFAQVLFPVTAALNIEIHADSTVLAFGAMWTLIFLTGIVQYRKQCSVEDKADAAMEG